MLEHQMEHTHSPIWTPSTPQFHPTPRSDGLGDRQGARHACAVLAAPVSGEEPDAENRAEPQKRRARCGASHGAMESERVGAGGDT